MTRRKMLTATVIGAMLVGGAALVGVAAYEGALNDDDDENENEQYPTRREPEIPAKP